MPVREYFIMPLLVRNSHRDTCPHAPAVHTFESDSASGAPESQEMEDSVHHAKTMLAMAHGCRKLLMQPAEEGDSGNGDETQSSAPVPLPSVSEGAGAYSSAVEDSEHVEAGAQSDADETLSRKRPPRSPTDEEDL